MAALPAAQAVGAVTVRLAAALRPSSVLACSRALVVAEESPGRVTKAVQAQMPLGLGISVALEEAVAQVRAGTTASSPRLATPATTATAVLAATVSPAPSRAKRNGTAVVAAAA